MNNIFGKVYLINLFLAILASSLRTLLKDSFICGTHQSQIVVVIIVMVLFTKLTLFLTRSTMRTNVRQLRPPSAGFYQACINFQQLCCFYSFLVEGHEKATKETEVSFKNCCYDETGILSIYNSEFYSFMF